MMNWFRRMMYGRYGSDALNMALLVLGLLVMMLARVTHVSLITLPAIALLFLCYFRMFSRNISARYAENQKFMRYWMPLSAKLKAKYMQWKDRKVHRYMKCPTCKSTLRVPTGRGKISVTCPKCKKQFIAKS